MEGKGIESGGGGWRGRTEPGERIKDAIHRSRHLLEPTLLEILRGGLLSGHFRSSPYGEHHLVLHVTRGCPVTANRLAPISQLCKEVT